MKSPVLIFLAVVAVLVLGSFYVVDERQTGILLQFGRVVETDIQPGLHFKLPLVQSAQRFDRRILLLNSQPQRYLTLDSREVSVDFFVTWRIAEVRSFYAATGGDVDQARQRLLPIVTDVVRNHVARRTSQVLTSGQFRHVGPMLARDANERARQLGVELLHVQLKHIDWPEDG
jgi:membrane protease subunit HflC